MASKPPTHILADSDWTKRYHAISFRKLMNIVKHESKPDTYTSTSAAYPPSAATRTYGGHVFAQAAWAAAHTVPYGLHIHSISGWFLLLGDTRYAFEYRIRRIRDGGVYALRIIEAYQNSEAGGHGKTPTFIAVVSFKRDERNKHKQGAKGQRQDFEHQELPHDYLDVEYGAVLGKKHSSDWPLSQGVDGMWVKDGLSIAEWKQRGDSFPGLEMRKVDMTGYNRTAPLGGREDGGEAARTWRLLTYYKVLVDEEDSKQIQRKTGADDLINLHACAHSYATDRNSLFTGQRALGFQLYQGHVGSLSHTVNYHGHASDWLMVDDQGIAKEYIREEWISSSGADRVTHQCRLWDCATGRIIVSTVQDGMMRIPMAPALEITDADALFRREAKI